MTGRRAHSLGLVLLFPWILPLSGGALIAQTESPRLGVESQIRIHTSAKGLDSTAWYPVRPIELSGGCKQLALMGMRYMGRRYVVDAGASPSKWARVDYVTVLRAQTRAADSLPWQEVDPYWMERQAPPEGCPDQVPAFYIGGGIGFGGARARESGTSDHTSGWIIHGRLGWRALLLDLEWHPYQLEYPPTAYYAGLAFSAIDVLPSVKVETGMGYYVQGGVGIQLRDWNVNSSQLSGSVLVAGASIGHTFSLSPTLTIAPELIGRYAFVSESPALEEASFVGLRVVLTHLPESR